jgi:hypothetical protein
MRSSLYSGAVDVWDATTEIRAPPPVGLASRTHRCSVLPQWGNAASAKAGILGGAILVGGLTSRLWLDDVMANRVTDKLTDRVKIEFVHNLGPMRFYRLDT